MPSGWAAATRTKVPGNGHTYPICVGFECAERTPVRCTRTIRTELRASRGFGALDADQAIAGSRAQVIQVRAQWALSMAVFEIDDHVTAGVVGGDASAQRRVRQLHAHARAGLTQQA